MSFEINVDIGGTFTDCYLSGDGAVATAKALTTHHNLMLGFLRAVEDLAAGLDLDAEGLLAETRAIRYATTLGTNALIERRGPRLALITTAGYEDVVPIGRCRQWGDGLPPQMTRDLARAERPLPLLEREMIVGVRERVDFAGNVVTPIASDEVREKVLAAVDAGARGFVVSLLFAYQNPEHELVVRDVIREEFPSATLGRFPIVLSHEISSKSGEYARTMTAVVNAYLHRFTSDRLSELRDELRARGYRGGISLVHNSGGAGSLSRTSPLQTVNAGPVAGIFGSSKLASRLELGKVVTTDMGGTSFDIGVVVAGSARFYEFNPVVDRWRVQLPMMDLKAVGAGGGSIARADAVSGIAVGPRSAGSIPGPACYGQGGSEPTTTDANLVLGYLNPDYYHGGTLPLDRRRAERAIERHVARPLGMSVAEAARGIRRMVDATMADAILKEVTLKGYDTREMTVVSFGGGGPLHACGYAAALDVDRVVIPPHAPVYSASGAAGLDVLHVYEASHHSVLFNPLTKEVLQDFEPINGALDSFAAQAERDFRDEGHPLADVQQAVEFDMRSGNQLYVTTIKSPVERIESVDDLALVLSAYFDEYGDRFGDFALTREVGVSIEAVRLRAWVPRAAAEATDGVGADGPPRLKGERPCWWEGNEEMAATPVYVFESLGPGHAVSGPALLEGADTTVVLPPEWTAEAHGSGHIDLTRG